MCFHKPQKERRRAPRREGRERELGADSASGWGAEGVSDPRCGACITALEARADKAQDDFVMKKPSDHRTHIHTVLVVCFGRHCIPSIQ